MPLQDILDAISAQADEQIATARSEHQTRISQMREAAERAQAKKRQELAAQKEQKKAQLKRKAEAHAETLRRNTLLRKKRELLDRLYNDALQAVSALPDDKVEPILKACLDSIPNKGALHPAGKHADLLKKLASSDQFTIADATSAKGGFVFVSEKEERDYTFEHIVNEWLRPKTELPVSQKLFS